MRIVYASFTVLLPVTSTENSFLEIYETQ